MPRRMCSFPFKQLVPGALAALILCSGAVWAGAAAAIYLLTEPTVARQARTEDTTRLAPVLIGQVEDARRLALPEVGGHLLVLTAGGQVWAWGDNSSGQRGDPDTRARECWTRVQGLDGVVAVAAGSLHSVALKRDGTVWTWGANDQGELGEGGFQSRWRPGPVPGLEDVVAVAAGSRFTLALRRDGAVWAFGSNWQGIVPVEGSRMLTHPVRVPELEGIVAITAVGGRGYANDSQGRIRQWGGGGEPHERPWTAAQLEYRFSTPGARGTAPLELPWPGLLRKNRSVLLMESSLAVREAVDDGTVEITTPANWVMEPPMTGTLPSM